MVYISLGSNMGNRLFNIRCAVEQLREHVFSESETSIIMETSAVLPPNAPKEWDKPYYNLVMRGKTHLSPPALLTQLKKIERDLGRPQVYERWSPRVMDLDILLYEQDILSLPELVIPHPEIMNRPFLLHLMALLDSAAVFPGLTSVSIGELAHRGATSAPVFLKSLVLEPQLVGVVNITPDSFSDGGCYIDPTSAVECILQLHNAGASIIEVGAQSTRPGARMVSPEEEYARLRPVLEKLQPYLQKQEIFLSVDSYEPSILLSLLKKFPIAWINDVKGALSLEVLSNIASHPCRFVAMHALGIPPTKENNLSSLNDLYDWAEKTIQQLSTCGFSRNRIILDPGIGFGKTAYQNLALLKQIQQLKAFQCPVLIGHSRKSYVSAFSSASIQERDLETIALSDFVYQAGVDYIRVHNIADHQRFLVAKQVINNCK